MEMKINEDYRIVSDPMCLMLQRRIIAQKGENAGSERWESMGYYPSVASALDSFIKRQLFSDQDLSGLIAINERLESIKTEIINAIAAQQ